MLALELTLSKPSKALQQASSSVGSADSSQNWKQMDKPYNMFLSFKKMVHHSSSVFKNFKASALQESLRCKLPRVFLESFRMLLLEREEKLSKLCYSLGITLVCEKSQYIFSCVILNFLKNLCIILASYQISDDYKFPALIL